MDIKEITQKLVHGYWKRDQWNLEYFDSVGFAEALISAYKAELLKEAGEPVLYAEFTEDGGWLGNASEYQDPLEEPHALYTSDQLVAAVLKATKPLEERRCEICGYAEHHREHTSCLRIQLAKVEQLLQVAQGRCDELEEKLAKAEQRVAEACAKVCEELDEEASWKEGRLASGHECAAAIREMKENSDGH